MAPTRLQEIHNDSSKIQLARISHVYYEHSDMKAFGKFAIDFGLVEAYSDDDVVLYRGYGIDPFCYAAIKAPHGKRQAFAGGAFVAQTQRDFDKAADMDGAKVSDMRAYPGGGQKVSVRTPAGFDFHVVFGQEERQTPVMPPSAQVESFGPLNGSIEKARFGKFQRFHDGPAMIHKLGHYGMHASNWYEEVDWYTKNFNFVPSDVQYDPSNAELDVITFMHLDLGEQYSDHHSLFVARGLPHDADRIHHSSFEVQDFDTQLLGHQWLASKNYKSVWGVGRHILGSQIFDYWRDTSGFTVEHYADGDLVNVKTGTKRSEAGAFAIWGPEMPKAMNEDGTLEVAPFAS